MNSIKLTECQRKIVEFQNGAALVVAGAGSGKTRVLAERIKRLISHKKGNYKILALTFSNKAAEELKTRLLDTFTEKQLSENIYVGTIHKFCMDIISSRGNAIGLIKEPQIFELLSDRYEILKKVFENNPKLKKILEAKQNDKEKEKFLKEVLEKISQDKRDFISPNDYLQDGKLYPRAYDEYNSMLYNQNAIEFDDILFYTYRIFTERIPIANLYRKIYKYILIDEAQDLNKAQYLVIRSIFSDRDSNIMMVGDPNQSIYQFNGSSSKYMEEEFRKDYNVTYFEMMENYRSSRSIIESAKKLEPNFSIKGVIPIEGEVAVISTNDEKSESEWVINKINELLSHGNQNIEGPITLEKCAVLARNKYVLNTLVSGLEEKRIPFYFKTGADPIESESDIMRIFELGLRVIINPADRVHLNQIFNLVQSQEQKEFPNPINRDNISLFNMIDFIEKGSRQYKIYSYLLNIWKVLIDSEGKFNKALEGIRTFIEQDGIFSEEDKSLIIEDLNVWARNWCKYLKNSTYGERTLAAFRSAISMGLTQTENNNGLALMSVHMSKGLEYDVVFIMGMNEGVFPDFRAIKAGDEQIEEEKHSAFVAITRSKRLCYITYPKTKTMPWGGVKNQLPSRFIIELGLPIEDIY